MASSKSPKPATSTKFGIFKNEVADHLSGDQVYKLATYLGLTPQEIDDIRYTQDPGLSFLTVLENNNTISIEGIGDLLEALDDCRMMKAALIAKDSYANLDNLDSDEPDVGVINENEFGEIKVIITNELTRSSCFQLATFFNLQEKDVALIMTPPDCAVRLIQKLDDLNIVNPENVGILISALQHRGLNKLASDILKKCPKLDPAVKKHTMERAHCVCDNTTFGEYRTYDGELVGLRCANTGCQSEWILGEYYRGTPFMTLKQHDKLFAYRAPIIFDKSTLEYKKINSIHEVNAGDHIAIRRYNLYDHHMIIIRRLESEKMEVVEWTRDKTTRKIGVLLNTIPFPGGEVHRVNYNDPNVKDEVKLVIGRALFSHEQSGKKYDIVKDNCETLASFCKTGVSFSTQGEFVEKNMPFLQWAGKKVLNKLSSH